MTSSDAGSLDHSPIQLLHRASQAVEIAFVAGLGSDSLTPRPARGSHVDRGARSLDPLSVHIIVGSEGATMSKP